MKLASYADGTRDGALMVVARDLSVAVAPKGIACSMIDALERWAQVRERLVSLSDALNSRQCTQAVGFEPRRCLAPLPRAPQWLDASAFLNHGRLMDRAFNNVPNPDFETIPMVYQGASDDFRGPYDDIPFPDQALQIDFEGEFGVVLDEVPMGVAEADALGHIRLVVQLNDWSLRAVGPREMRSGFGFIQAKPSCSFAPLAVTPDELGAAWQQGRVHLRLHVARGQLEVGRAHGAEMHFSFQRIVAHCARTRRLSPGTVVGSGTISNAAREAGSSCLSEVRVIEQLDRGAPQTEFLCFGETIRMEARDEQGNAPFGRLANLVVQG